MAKWTIPANINVQPAQEALHIFTYGPDQFGNLHFYVDGKRVGAVRKAELPNLILEAAEQLRK